MLSFLYYKQNVFCFIRQSIFENRDQKLLRLTRAYIEPLLFLLYIKEIPQALWSSHTCLDAGVPSIFYQHKKVTAIENLWNCVNDFCHLKENSIIRST